jgi:methanogenic corrinoid protein MtbC1
MFELGSLIDRLREEGLRDKMKAYKVGGDLGGLS